jgi:predicted phosphodiesterase
MKAAIISDIHSNLEALQVVIKDIKRKRIKSIFCLGDLVGYGANPNECVELSMKESKIVVAGNHDWAALEKTDIATFNPVAAEAIRWTRDKITKTRLNQLSSLKFTASVDNILLVHATPEKPERWNYVLALDDFKKQFKFFKEQVCLIGHSHIPTAVYQDANGYTDYVGDDSFPLIDSRRYIINAGSVGQPRDLDPRATYAIYDGNKKAMEFVRLDYNVPRAQQKILDAGLPEILAERLLAGR